MRHSVRSPRPHIYYKSDSAAVMTVGIVEVTIKSVFKNYYQVMVLNE